MKIISRIKLTEEEKLQIAALERVCYEKDKLENHVFLFNEMNYDKSIPAFFLAYEGVALIGFLTIFIPTREEAEISAMVHPAFQRKGVFSKLDEIARQIIAANGIGRTLYCVETKSKSAGQVLKAWGIFRILRSEYRMKLHSSQLKRRESTASEDGAFSVRRATPENIADYLNISNRAYGQEENGYADTIMTSDIRMGYVFYRDEEPIGVFAIGLEKQGEPFLYGVAIAEEHRGRGYGRLLMERACGIGAEYGNTLQLDVDSDNPVAFRLYQRMGFEITFQVDYYMR